MCNLVGLSHPRSTTCATPPIKKSLDMNCDEAFSSWNAYFARPTRTTEWNRDLWVRHSDMLAAVTRVFDMERLLQHSHFVSPASRWVTGALVSRFM